MSNLMYVSTASIYEFRFNIYGTIEVKQRKADNLRTFPSSVLIEVGKYALSLHSDDFFDVKVDKYNT